MIVLTMWKWMETGQLFLAEEFEITKEIRIGTLRAGATDKH